MDVEFLSTVETYELERIFDIFYFKKSFTKLLENTFFSFLYKNQNMACLVGEKWAKNYCSTFRFYLTNIILPWNN
jgi:hypothetical protein